MMADFNLSILTQPSNTGIDDSALVESLHNALRAAETQQQWTTGASGPWYSVTPNGIRLRPQGWKLHVSATVRSAEQVLRSCVPLLLSAASPFKFAATLDTVAQLNARHTSRGHSGKFLTIYPNSDDEAVALADALHTATTGLEGPRILSDRPYRADSLVHYRYGAFVEQRRFSQDGFYAWVIEGPDGKSVEDRRIGQYTPPEWAECPFPEQKPEKDDSSQRKNKGSGNATKAKGILIGDRFLASEAIRHTNRGGVYRAIDTHTDAAVVIKEVRPHVGTDFAGRDEQDRLRAEVRALNQLAESTIAPQVVAVFEQARHLFLAEEMIQGVPLRQWVPDRIRENGWRQENPKALSLAARLTELVIEAHSAGLVLRDFNPNNIMVSPDGDLRLIDLELATITGSTAYAPMRVGTPGFSSQEQLDGAEPSPAADYFSLGATLCFLVIGTVPYLLPDSPVSEHEGTRIAEWISARWETADLPDTLRKLITGLMDNDPNLRPTAVHARKVLAGLTRDDSRRHVAGNTLSNDDLRNGIDGIVGYLIDTMSPTDERLWPASCANGSPDPCNVQHGAAGTLGTLTRCLELDASNDERITSAIGVIGDWIIDRAGDDLGRGQGLYFGEAGIAWALHEAGTAIGRDRFKNVSADLANQLPVSAANPDITHGTAGLTLSLIHLWQLTGNESLLRKAGDSAEALLVTAEDGPDGLNWGTPVEHISQLAGRRYYGFAHGNAGVAYALLVAALATGRSDYLDVARRVGKALLNRAIITGDLALWGAGTGDEATAPHWCHGSSGIGTFLIRLYRATGDEEFLRYADMAAQAVMQCSARSVLAQCHGLAGNGEFLLDMASATGDDSYTASAHRLGRLAYTYRTLREGRLVFPDEHNGLTVTWGDGMTGVLSFLLRLRHGGNRMWMVDELLDRSEQA